MMSRPRWICAAIVVLLLVPFAIIGGDILRDVQTDDQVPAGGTAMIERGAYLAKAGNCAACHTMPGGAEYAGGRAIHTPFGKIYASNLTPDPETGLGSWTDDDFWRALHLGKGRDGNFLYPAFPYTNTTRITRSDANALFTYLRTLRPVRQYTPAPDLSFPFNQRILLPFWRLLYFTPGEYVYDRLQSATWNRGAYLVQGLGHCSACHTARNALGGSEGSGDLAGGMIPMLGWQAASLVESPGLGSDAELAQLLSTGVSARGAVFGPMNEVVRGSLQYLEPGDIQAIVTYLNGRPLEARAPLETFEHSPELAAQLARGAVIYKDRCSSCHQADGSGAAPAYPPLQGSRSLREPGSVNAIRMVLFGGFPPSTQGNPRPYGMPPFGPALSDDEVAAVLTYARHQWGAKGSPLTARQVQLQRSVPLE